MRDLTSGPVAVHILRFASLIALTMAFQTLYFLADLYFVGRLGPAAIAGVGLAGNLMLIVLALTQSLGAGTTALVSQALGRRDPARAVRLFNQAIVLALIVGAAYGVVMFSLRVIYSDWLAADRPTAVAAARYLDWFVLAMSLQFPLVTMGAALRGVGDFKVPTIIQVATVFLNIGLAPVLIFGLGPAPALGVAGAAIASVIAIGAGTAALVIYFRRAGGTLRLQPRAWRPQPALWGEMLKIGLPAGGEFVLIAVYATIVYAIIQPFGAEAQAGFGIGVRVMQSLFLPAVAIGFATAPVAGQNYGARQGDRVRATFRTAGLMAALVMSVITLVCQIAPAQLVGLFSADAGAVAFGAEYLRIISWTFVLSGLIFVSSSMFQGLGNTLPPLASSSLRVLLFAVPAQLIARTPGFQMRHVWYLSVASVAIQAALTLWLLRREIALRLPRGGALADHPAR
jgi:putative MATE family efflux protein